MTESYPEREREEESQMNRLGSRTFRRSTHALSTMGTPDRAPAPTTRAAAATPSTAASTRPPIVVEACSKYTHVLSVADDGTRHVRRLRGFELQFQGNPWHAPAKVLTDALARQAELARSRPAIQARFLDLDARDLDSLEPEFFATLTRSFEAPRTKESERLYSGFRSLDCAQRALVSLPPMFVTHALEEAHRYSNARSVILCFAATSDTHRSHDNPSGAAEYRSARDARADGLRVIGVIRGEGEFRNPSALGGTSYD